MKRIEFIARVRTATGRHPQAPIDRPPLPVAASTPQNPRALAERFKLEHERVLGKVHLVDTPEAAQQTLRTLLEGKKSLVRSTHAILDEVGLGTILQAAKPTLQFLPAADAEVGITGCEGGIAATGSLGFSSQWGRLAALLPHHHIVVLRANQLVPDLEDWYIQLSEQPLPGAWGMHTGPSKSADIEQTMALGVHGPGKVDVILLS